ATVRAGNPREALSQLDEALDDALMATGLFEEFDVTGKVLRVGPLDQVWRLSGLVIIGPGGYWGWWLSGLAITGPS
ncbi:MAG TPA: hypothetical protein VGN41_25425, partial [Streptosporangiaceae bacterium]